MSSFTFTYALYSLVDSRAYILVYHAYEASRWLLAICFSSLQLFPTWYNSPSTLLLHILLGRRDLLPSWAKGFYRIVYFAAEF